MKTIRFKGENESQAQCWQTIRKRVNEYFKEEGISTKSDHTMIWKTVAMLSLYIAPFVALLIFAENIWLAIPLTFIMGIGTAGIGMSVMHDGLHGSYSSRKWVNNLSGASMYLIGSNVFNWKIQHNIYHHAYTNIDGMDEDIQTRWIIRLSEHTPLKKIHQLQHIYAFFLYSLMTFSMFIGDYTQLIGYHKAGIIKKHNSKFVPELLKMSLVKVIYFCVIVGLPLLLTDYNILQVLIGFTIMHLVAGFILTMVFQMAHIAEGTVQPMPDENGITKNEWAIHQLLTTSNFAPNNLLLNWYVGGLNFQIEHHLFPNICHIHYRKLSPIVEQTAKEFGITYNIKPTLRNALISHSKRLRELGRN
jgi:linoleoyl-CoA desaturase